MARILVGALVVDLEDLPSIRARAAGGPTTLDVLSDWDSFHPLLLGAALRRDAARVSD